MTKFRILFQNFLFSNLVLVFLKNKKPCFEFFSPLNFEKFLVLVFEDLGTDFLVSCFSNFVKSQTSCFLFFKFYKNPKLLVSCFSNFVEIPNFLFLVFKGAKVLVSCFVSCFQNFFPIHF